MNRHEWKLIDLFIIRNCLAYLWKQTRRHLLHDILYEVQAIRYRLFRTAETDLERLGDAWIQNLSTTPIVYRNSIGDRNFNQKLALKVKI